MDAPAIGWLRHVFLPPSESFIAGSLRAIDGHDVRVRVLTLLRRSADKFPRDDLRVLADAPRGWLEVARYWATGLSPRVAAWAREIRLIHAHMGPAGAHALR